MGHRAEPSSILALADLATPMSVRVAATLDLVEHAGPGGATVAELAAATGTSTPALRHLLDHLVTAGVFHADPGTGRYRPTEIGNRMHGDDPAGVKRLLDIGRAGGRAELAFVELLDTVRTGEPAYPRRYGRDFWADLDTDPGLRESFDAQMAWRFRGQTPQLARNPVWGRFARIVDVGGGDGAVLAAVLDAHPGLRGQVLDLPPAAAAAAARFAADGLADRAEAVPGSFFDPLPAGADAYLLCDVLHDWDDEHARRILDGCRWAAGPGGTVLVIEPLRGTGVGTAVELFMLVCFGGRERTVAELTALAGDQGLVLRGSAPVAEGRSLLEFVVPAP